MHTWTATTMDPTTPTNVNRLLLLFLLLLILLLVQLILCWFQVHVVDSVPLVWQGVDPDLTLLNDRLTCAVACEEGRKWVGQEVGQEVGEQVGGAGSG